MILENNKYMDKMLLINIAVSLFFLMIFLIPINLKARVFYNVLKNKGNIKILIFKLTLLNYQFSIENGFVELVSKKSGKIKLMPIDFTSEEGFLSDTDFATLIIKKIYIQHATIYINFGTKTDAFLTAMVVGICKVFGSIFGAILKSKKTESKIKNKIYPSFDKDKLEVSVKASIKISIFQVNNCFIKAMINKFKHKRELLKNERN